MSTISLVGGGWEGDLNVWRPFVSAAAERRPDHPRIAVIAVRADAHEHAERLIEDVRPTGAGFTPVVVALAEGDAFDPAVLDDVDGVLVGGGRTPAYAATLASHAARFRSLAAAGVPYAGFSAGAAIAASRAVVGGWRLDGRPVVDEEVGEGLEAVTVVDGLGLVPSAVDVHAAQWGTLARLVAAVQAGLVPRGVAIDESTALVVREGRSGAVGSGNLWHVEAAGDAVQVRREPVPDRPRRSRDSREQRAAWARSS